MTPEREKELHYKLMSNGWKLTPEEAEEYVRGMAALRRDIEELQADAERRHNQQIELNQSWNERCKVAELRYRQLQDEISSCSHHHAQPWQLPDWAKTWQDVKAATDEQLNDLMGVCHMEDGDPRGRCLACYAYRVACEREDAEKKDLAAKQFERGYSDGRANHSPSLLRGPYMDGYIKGRSEPRSEPDGEF
jgi:hypothetical protein